MVATAVAAAGVAASVGSSIAGGSGGAGAASGASNAQVQAQMAALAEQQREFDTLQGNIKPWIGAGTTALGSLMQLMGLGPVTGAATTPSGATAAPAGGTPAVPATPGMAGGTTAAGGAGVGVPMPTTGTIDPAYLTGGPPAGMTITGWTNTSAGGGGMPTWAPIYSSGPGTTAGTGTPGTAGTTAPAGNALGVGAPGTLTAPFNPTISQLEQTPGYQFLLDQGLKATQNSYAAQGLGGSGAAIKGATNYATGLAGTTFQQQFQNYWAQNQNIYNMISGVSSLGENAAVMAGNQGTQQALANSNLLTGIGNSQAAGIVGSQNAITGGLLGAGNTLFAASQNQNLMSGPFGSSGGGATPNIFNTPNLDYANTFAGSGF